jgi:hypothetical protein
MEAVQYGVISMLHCCCCCCAGPLPIDKDVYSQLLATGQFEQMNLDVDEVWGMLGYL